MLLPRNTAEATTFLLHGMQSQKRVGRQEPAAVFVTLGTAFPASHCVRVLALAALDMHKAPSLCLWFP